MAFKVSMALFVLVVIVNSHPFGFGLEIRGKSEAGVGGSAGGKVGGSTDDGVNAGGKAKGEVHGFWNKLLYGKVYGATNSGKGMGISGNLGSNADGRINGTAAVGGDTNLVSSHGGGKAGLDADVHYKAGGNVDLMTADELEKSAKTFKHSDHYSYNIHGDDSDSRAKYKQWLK